MKARKDPGILLPRLPILPRRGLISYLLLLTAAVIFTQLIRSFLTAVVLWFLLILPFFDLLILVLSRFFVSAGFKERDRTFSRGDSAEFTVAVRNRCVFPISCAEVAYRLPRSDAAKAKDAVLRIALPPVSESLTEITVPLCCRGLFEIGVEAIYVTDFLHLFRLRKRCDEKNVLRVLPKALPLRFDLPPIPEATPSRAVPVFRSASEEYGDIRDYRPGDSVKAIHWKLSSKTEDWQVRDRSTENGRTVRLCVDFGDPETVAALNGAAAKPEEDKTPIGAFSSLAQAVANRTAEEALRFARQTVRDHAYGILTWRERDGSEPIYRFSTPAEAEALTYPLSEADGAALSPVPPADREDVSLTLYLLPYLAASDGDRIRRILAGRTETEVAAALLDFSSFLPPDRREACLAGRKALARDLTESGVSVILPPEQEEAS